jgi:uncharacterized protein (TIGR02646 family)
MRPITKYLVNSICPVTRSLINRTYSDYKSAKPYLTANLGPYCSYCERPISDESMHVEHIKPKNKYTQLETQWINFLVSCQRCNGKDNKSDKIPKLNLTHFPTINNTFKSFVYHDDGRVSVNSALIGIEKNKANQLLKLVNLHLIKGDPNHKEKDKRDELRRTSFILAKRYLNMWESNEFTNIDIIIDLAKERGNWSIWMQVFSNHKNIQLELINAFNGTYIDCLIKNINKL